MDSMMKYISRIHHCSNMWRGDKLSDRGLNGAQHVYIFQICKNPGISQEKLAQRIMVNKSNVARQLSKLESSGMIERQVSMQDKRNYEVYPTEKAKEALPEVKALMNQWNELLLEDLNEEEKAFLLGILPKLARKAKELCDNGGNER